MGLARAARGPEGHRLNRADLSLRMKRWVLALVLFVACSTRPATPAEQALSRQFLQLLADGKNDSAFALYDPELRNNRIRGALPLVGGLLRDARMDSLRFVGVSVQDSTHDVTIKYDVPTRSRRWVTGSVTVRTVGTRAEMTGLSAAPSDQPAGVSSSTHYLLLMLAIILPLVAIGLTSGRTIADQSTLRGLVERLRRLRPDTPRRWGTMASAELLCHLGDAQESVLGKRIPPGPRPSGVPRPFFKWLIVYSPLPWPKGRKTRPGVDPRIDGTRPGDFERDRERAIGSLMNLATADPTTLAPVHFMFGPMSAQDWRRWAFRHVTYHLRQFGL